MKEKDGKIGIDLLRMRCCYFTGGFFSSGFFFAGFFDIVVRLLLAFSVA
jgi:hypothetical protein